MKRNLLIVLSLIMLLTILVSCNKAPAGEKTEAPAEGGKAVTLRVGHVEPEDRSTHKALLDFKKNVEERTEGKVKVELYANGALGGDVQLIESVAMGALEMALPATSVLTTYSEEFGILDMPYLFKDAQSAFAALDGEVGQYFDEILLGQGIKSLGYSYNGPRSTTTSSKPIEKPEDFVGVKMRVMESPIFIDFYKTLGANPTPMSFTELYTGLQQGTVEAQENPPSLIYANKFYEVQKYLSVTGHVHNFLVFAMNNNTFEALDDDVKEIVLEEGRNYVDNQRQMELDDTEVAIELLATEGGLTVNRIDEAQTQAFRDALQPMYDKYESQFGAELFEMTNKYN